MPEHRIGVLASGRGSNLQSILDACTSGYIPGRVAVVISDNPGAYALQRASEAGVPGVYINPGDYQDKEEYERALANCLQEYEVEVVCLAGYMRLVGRVMLKEFESRILNIHPSLLPAFPGLHAQKQAWDYGVKYSGCTVHFIDSGMDTGPIVLQEVVPVKQDDTPESLAERILEQEHQVYPRAVKLFLEGKLKIRGRKVDII